MSDGDSDARDKLSEEQLIMLMTLMLPAVQWAFEQRLSYQDLLIALRSAIIRHGTGERLLSLASLASDFFDYSSARQLHTYKKDYLELVSERQAALDDQHAREHYNEDIRSLLRAQPMTAARLMARLKALAKNRWERANPAAQWEEHREQEFMRYMGHAPDEEQLRLHLEALIVDGQLEPHRGAGDTPYYKTTTELNLSKGKTRDRDYMFGQFVKLAKRLYRVTAGRYEEREHHVIRTVSLKVSPSHLHRIDWLGDKKPKNRIELLYKALETGLILLEKDSELLQQTLAGLSAEQDQDEDQAHDDRPTVHVTMMWSVEEP